jgi:hypothetical protein
MTVRGEVVRDKREERDSRDGRGFEVRSLRFSELRTQNLELRIVLVSPVSLESGIGDCSRSAHEYCGLRQLERRMRRGDRS